MTPRSSRIGVEDVVDIERAEVGRHLRALGGDGAAVVHRHAGQPGAAVLEVQVGRVAVVVGDVQEDVLAADPRRASMPIKLVADRRRHLEPGLPGAHDRVHLGGAESAGRGVERAARAGVGVGAGQHLSGPGQSVLGDHLVADAVPADVVEALDAEVGGELRARGPPAASLMRGRGHGVVHHDRELVGIMNLQGLHPHRGELQVDQHGHVDVDDDGVADFDGSPGPPCERRSSRSSVMPIA